MKYLLTLLAMTMAAADKLDNTYLPPSNAQSAAGGGAGLQTPRGGGAPQFRGGQAPRGFSGGQSQGQGPQGYAGGQSPQGHSGGQSPQGSGVGAPYSGGQSSGGQGQGQNYGGQGQAFGVQSQGQSQGGSGQNQAEILRFENEQNEEGYHYAYETSDGTKAEQQGRNIPGSQPEEGSLQVQGSYSYVGDDGQTYSVTYTADENGFRAEGAHLPTPPPIPEAILKSLQLTAGGGAGNGGAGGAGQGGAGGPQSQYGSPKSSYDSDAGAGYHYK